MRSSSNGPSPSRPRFVTWHTPAQVTGPSNAGAHSASPAHVAPTFFVPTSAFRLGSGQAGCSTLANSVQKSGRGVLARIADGGIDDTHH